MKKISYIWLIFVLLACLSCESKGLSQDEHPVPDKVERFTQGHSFYSKILHRNVCYSIFLPADYDETQDCDYPSVYMLHGFGENSNAWSDRWTRVIERLEDREGLQPMIYIFPDGFNSYYCNTYDGKTRYMDMFTQELVPEMDKLYATRKEAASRIVLGYSMGGFGAMVLPMKHPELFSYSGALSMSFRTDQQYMSEPQSGWDYQWGRIFGGKGTSGEARLTDYYKEHCPLYQFTAENFEKYSKVHWFLHCGDDEEQLLIANDDLNVMMKENGYNHEYRVGNGAHDDYYWRKAMSEVLPWAQHIMNGGGEWKQPIDKANPVDIVLNEDKTFTSKAYNQLDKKSGVAIYLVYKGLDPTIIRNIMSIVQRDADDTYSFAILPCDLSQKSLELYMSEYVTQYSVGETVDQSQVIVLGEAGLDVYRLKNRFSRIYMDNAVLSDNITAINADPDKFWYFSRTDDCDNYKDMNALYKSCKKLGTDFQYRVRNGIDNTTESILIGIEKMKPYIKFK